MKLNITVDLEDFYADEDGEGLTLSEDIKQSISYSITSKIKDNLRKDAMEIFTQQIAKEINDQKSDFITDTIKDIFANKKIKKRYRSEELITLHEYILDRVQDSMNIEGDFIRRLNELVEIKSDVISSSLKDRYDMRFASQIVSKLNQNGMLKDDVAKMLLTENEK